MISYIIRRLLLIIPTFFGTTFLVFWILNIAPDGPFDQEIKKLKAANMQSGETSGGGMDDKPPGEIDEEVLKKLKREYGLDKSILHRYLIWLGVAKKEVKYVEDKKLNEPYAHLIENTGEIDKASGTEISLKQYIFPALIDGEIVVYESSPGVDADLEGYERYDQIDFETIGFIKKIRIFDPYLFTIKNIGTEKNPILLQKYILPAVVDKNGNSAAEGELVVKESIECTNISHKDYKTIPSSIEELFSQDESFWKDSKWVASRTKKDPNIVNIILNDKSELVKSKEFNAVWKKSTWQAKRNSDITNFETWLKQNEDEYTDKVAARKDQENIRKNSNFKIDSNLSLNFKNSNASKTFYSKAKDLSFDNWLKYKDKNIYIRAVYLNKEKAEKDFRDLVEISYNAREGILTGYLGESNQGEDVSGLIWDRIHISAFFGITGFILSYLVCIPLGIMKALRHGSKFDISSSFFVFIGYSIPNYAFGVLVIWIFATSNVFAEPLLPSKGWRPLNWEELSIWGKMFEQLRHALLPTLCYMLGSFATLTVLMKNSLMENMSQDYVRTAFAKGLTEKTVIFKHAVRNSLIPLATGIGGLIGIFLAGSYLIEKVFGIDGIGMLGFKAIQDRDFGIFLGFLVIGTIVRLLGNLISDICYAVIDPRIRFK